MEDVAITEISRGQIWQQLRFRASLAEGSKVTPAIFARFLAEEMEAVAAQIGEEAYRSGRFSEAMALFTELSMAEELEPFMTLAAYRLI
jgi:malate synthase